MLHFCWLHKWLKNKNVTAHMSSRGDQWEPTSQRWRRKTCRGWRRPPNLSRPLEGWGRHRGVAEASISARLWTLKGAAGPSIQLQYVGRKNRNQATAGRRLSMTTVVWWWLCPLHQLIVCGPLFVMNTSLLPRTPNNTMEGFFTAVLFFALPTPWCAEW